MNQPARWEDIERLYHEALALPAFERKALFARASPALREEVESLLEADSSSGLLTAPPTHLAADLLDGQPGGLTAGQRVANYEVESLISVGGMGEVYLARDTSQDSGKGPVALKILRRHLIVNAQAVDRFETEVRAAAALCHPNIVTISSPEELRRDCSSRWNGSTVLPFAPSWTRAGWRSRRPWIGPGKPRELCRPRTRRESCIAI